MLIGVSVILLLFFVPLDPKLTSLLFVCNNLLVRPDFVTKLNLTEFKGLLYTHLLGFQCRVLSGKSHNFLVHLINFLLVLVKLVILQIDSFNEALITLMLIFLALFSFVSSLVHIM